MRSDFPAQAPAHAAPSAGGYSQFASADLTLSLLKAHRIESSPSSSCFLPSLAFQHWVCA